MRFLFTIGLLLFSGALLAQTATALSTDIDDRLLVKYDRDYLEQMQTEHPVLLQRLNYYLDNAWYVADFPSEKKLVDLPTVQIEDLEHFNILELEIEQQLQRNPQEQVIYEIADTDKVLVYHSSKKFNQNFNRLRR